jgi:hypothetical protein
MVRAYIRILRGLLMTLNSHPDLWASSDMFQKDYVSTFPPDTSTQIDPVSLGRGGVSSEHPRDSFRGED